MNKDNNFDYLLYWLYRVENLKRNSLKHFVTLNLVWDKRKLRQDLSLITGVYNKSNFQVVNFLFLNPHRLLSVKKSLVLIYSGHTYGGGNQVPRQQDPKL